MAIYFRYLITATKPHRLFILCGKPYPWLFINTPRFNMSFVLKYQSVHILLVFSDFGKHVITRKMFASSYFCFLEVIEKLNNLEIQNMILIPIFFLVYLYRLERANKYLRKSLRLIIALHWLYCIPSHSSS